MGKMRVEFGDLKLGEEAKNNLMDVVRESWASAGPKVKEFEEKWGKLFGYKHSIAMASGTAADTAACMALFDFGAKRGDEVIVPALAFAAAGNSILAAGLTPVFVDIKRETLNIDETKIEEKITPKTRAIMVVHTMGKPCKMDKIMEIARKHKLKVIEDSCESHGAKYNGKFVGNWGDMAAFSYYIAHLVCCGEGGMVSTNDDKVADVLKSVKSHGRRNGDIYFDHVRPGINGKMNDLEASIGLPEIGKFWQTFNGRRINLFYLLNKVKDLQKFAYFNSENEGEVICPHAFSITLKDPKYNCKELYAFLESNGIKCKRNFGSMPTQHEVFAFMGHKLGEFPEAEYVGENGLHFGIHQFLTVEDLDFISDKMHEYFARFN